MWNIGGGDSNSRVAHCKCHRVGMEAESELHLAAGGRVFNRICYKIEKQLTKPGRISHDRDICGERKIHRDARAFAEDQCSLVDVLHERLESDRLAMNVEATLVGARQGEETLYEIRHSRRFMQC